MLPAWSFKFTGTKDGVRKRVESHPSPFEDPPKDATGEVKGEPLNIEQFNALRKVILAMLDRSPCSCVEVTAEGYHSPEGRARVLVTFEPKELHV